MLKKLFLLVTPLALFANLNIAVSYPYIGALTKSIGGENINAIVLAKGNWDPHFIVPRPSLIAKVRGADGIIINGGQLEIGWLPPLLDRAANNNVKVNGKGFLNLFEHIEPIDKPQFVDRSCGDIHPDGNPHFQLDPNNILRLAEVIKIYLIYLDPDNKNSYQQNYENFLTIGNKKLQEWNAKMQDKKGIKVVQFHDNMAYFNKAYGLENIGTIEPLPGIPPSAKHTLSLIKLIKSEKPSYILHDVYHSTKTAKFIVSKTGIKLILMPHDVEAMDDIHDLISLFDYLTGAIQ